MNKQNETLTAHAALCRSIDAMTPAWASLTPKQTRRLQRIVDQIETLRDELAAAQLRSSR